MTVIKLTNPIQAHGETLTELNLREPTVEDVAELGYPFIIVQGDNGSGIELRPKVVLKYAGRLAQIPPSSLKSLSMDEFSQIQAVVMDFFGGGAITPQP